MVISADKSPSRSRGHRGAPALAPRLGPGRRHPSHDLRAAPRHPAVQGRADEGARCRPRCWNSWPTRSSPTCASSKARSTASSPTATLVGRPITLETTQEVLHDLLRANDRRVTIEEIQQRVAEHFNIKLADMHSARRARAVARPRQVAMYLAKQLTTALAARDRPQIRRPRPHHGHACGAQDRGALHHRCRLLRGCRAAPPHAGGLSPTPAGPSNFDLTGRFFGLRRRPERAFLAHFDSAIMAQRPMIGPSANRPTASSGGLGVAERSSGRSQKILRTAMKLTIERGALLKSLGHVQSVVERRNTIPILSNVLLEAGANAARPDRDRHGYRRSSSGRRPRSAAAAPPRRPPIRSTTSCASCPKAPRSRSTAAATARQAIVRAGPLAIHACRPCRAEDFPAMTGRRAAAPIRARRPRSCAA